MCNNGPDQLQAEHQQDEHQPENLTRSALCQPSLQPGKDHLHQQQVEHSECSQHNCGPYERQGLCHRDTQPNSQQTQAANRAGGIKQPKRHADQEIRTIAKRESKQFCRIGIIGQGRGHDGEELPEQENGPQDQREILGLALRNQQVREKRGHQETARATEREHRTYHHARGEFSFAAPAAQAVDEHPPAQFSYGL